jgi:flagella synthesis protein FlgN
MAMNALQKLSSLLQSEINHGAQLAQLLRQEREALRGADVDTVQHISKQKQPHIIQLEQLGRQREYLLKAAGFPGGKSGLEAFIANYDERETEGVRLLMTKLRDIAGVCREFNQINGGIVNVNRQHLTRALSILRGRDPEGAAYGPGGQFTNQIVRQPLLGRV